MSTEEPTLAAARAPFLPLLRDLARTYQAFVEVSGRHIRSMGLTPAQFDVVSTLGNTSGMGLSALAERTLITKSALTGVIDRLERRGLVERRVPADDRRCFRAVLTSEGERVFEETFCAHIEHIGRRFESVDAAKIESLRAALCDLHAIFTAAPTEAPANT